MAKKFGKGDVIWIDFTPSQEHEQSGRRPALVLSPELYNTKTGLLIACPITSQQKGYQFEVPIKGQITGAVLVDQIRNVAWGERNALFIERANSSTQAKVKQLLGTILP